MTCANPSQNGGAFNWLLGGGAVAVASSDPELGSHPIPVPTGGVLSGSTTGGGSPLSSFTWTWDLAPG